MANQLTERFNRLVKTVRGEARLTEANLHNDPSALHETLRLLGEIESAWNAIPSAQRQRPALTNV